ncbi:hypothetical protein PPL_05395 [Heterostelium album PN500]|uniref:Ankyrin repeat protein n=1 Tax=Heterostelium pallidum (strain ATCC 26659 / Pp 5 / PN500) TaxID=670386 RepID=D3BA23_HETP5|nr:hypothetical protein PPL_05395 [Heterostelium album PN500]EFA81410.1 hypothetical protein PPL_05395 [Heterostelium album PN500]|eukprot:XP_020433528.1 hypothetical protein PPL_05395 [Heterostelium album PN500]
MEKQLFISIVINNRYLSKIIFKYVSEICYEINHSRRHIDWYLLRESPNLLALNRYYDLLKQWFQRYRYEKIDLESLVVAAVIGGSIEIVDHLIDRFQIDRQTDRCTLNTILIAASKYNRLTIIQHLWNQYQFEWNYYKSMVLAPYSKNIDILSLLVDRYNKHELFQQQQQKFVEIDYDKDGNVFDNAAYVGNIEMLEYLRESRTKDLEHSFIFIKAVTSDQLELLRYLLASSDFNHLKDVHLVNNLTALDIALQRKHQVEIAISLLDAGCKTRYTGIMNRISSIGSIKLMESYHRRNFTEPTSVSLDHLNYYNYIESVKWLQSHSYPLTATTNAMDTACRLGNLEVVKYLHYNRSEGCTMEAIDISIENDHVEVVKFLYQNRTEGSKKMSSQEISKWINENQKI